MRKNRYQISASAHQRNWHRGSCTLAASIANEIKCNVDSQAMVIMTPHRCACTSLV